jgi:hypothetical protein
VIVALVVQDIGDNDCTFQGCPEESREITGLQAIVHFAGYEFPMHPACMKRWEKLMAIARVEDQCKAMARWN